jgi:hypothetical protein
MSTRTNKNVVKLISTYVLAILFLTLTNPKRLPSVVLVVSFMLIFLALYYSVMAILDLSRDRDRQTIVGLQVLRPRIVACLIAGFPILLLVLQSIGQLTARDVITAGAILVIAYFYVAKFSTNLSER